jgi:molecular chaperone DnaJ
MAKDYYQILGISKNATQTDIKKAYRKLAHQYHPDKGGDEQKFKEINEAYQILSNTEKKHQYDQFGRAFEGGGFQGGQPGWDFGFDQGFDPSDVDFDLGEIFGEMFGFGGPARKRDLKRGKDIEVEIELPLEAILKTQEKEISLNKEILCTRCQGRGAEPGSRVKECFSCRGQGEVQQIKKTFLGSFIRYTVCPECGGEGSKPEKPCNVCKGEGRIKGEEKIKIFIPAGVDTNQVIKIEGGGEAGKKGGKAGNLYLRIFIKKHPIFQRRGDDIFVSLPVSFSQAALGDEVELSTLEGSKLLLKIPQGTESGKVLRVSGKGIPHFSGWGRGDMFMEFIVKTPKKLTKKQKELLEKLKEEGI